MKDPAPALLPSSPVLALGNNIIKMSYDLSYFTLKYKIAFRSLSCPIQLREDKGKNIRKKQEKQESGERGRKEFEILHILASYAVFMPRSPLATIVVRLHLSSSHGMGLDMHNSKENNLESQLAEQKIHIFFFNVSWQQKSLPSQRTKYFRFQLL